MAQTAREILANIRFVTDQASIDTAVGGVDRVTDSLQGFSQTIQQQISQGADEFVAADQSMIAGFNDLQPVIDEQIQQINTLADSYRAAYNASMDAANGGGEGGGEGGDIEGIGNPLAVGRGARALGALAPGIAPEARGAADILFIQRGLQELQGTFESLNGVVTATPGLLAPVVEGFTALGIPMAGLVAVAAPIAVAIGGLIIAFNEFTAVINSGTQAIKDATTAREEQSKLEGSGTTQSLTESRDKALAEQGGDQSVLDAMKQKRTDIENTLKTEGESGNTDAALTVALIALNGQISDQQKKVDAAAGSIDNYNTAIASQQVAANDAAEKTRQQADALIAGQARTAQYDTLNNQQIDDQVKKLQDETSIRQAAIAVLQANNDAQGTSAYQIDLNNKKIDEYNAEINQNTGDIDHLIYVSRDLADARAREEEATKAVEAAVKSLAEQDKILAQEHDEETKLRQSSDQAQLKAMQDADDAVAQSADAQVKLTTDAKRKEEDIVQASGDKIADIREKEGEQEAAAFTKYQDQIADDLTKYSDQRAKLIADAQNTEATNFFNEQVKMRDLVTQEHNTEANDQLQHEQKLADIRRSAMEDEQQAVLDGNFEKIYQDQQAEKNKETDENVRYANQIDNARTQLSQQEQAEAQHYEDSEQLLRFHLQQQEQAQDTALQQEETAQVTAYNRKLRDLAIAEDNEIDQTNTAEQRKERDLQTWQERQLEDINTAETAKINLINVNLGRELQMYQNNFNARMQLLQQELQDQQALIGGSSGGASYSDNYGYLGSPTKIPQMADGGDFPGGNPFIMSEVKDETLRIAGRSYRVGGGAAMVYPSQGGSVTPSSGGNQIGDVSIILQGRFDDPMANAQMIREAVAPMLAEWSEGTN